MKQRPSTSVSEEKSTDSVLNRASTTFREMPAAEKDDLGAEKAVALKQAQPTMIKRPMLDLGDGRLSAGFKPPLYEAALRP